MTDASRRRAADAYWAANLRWAGGLLAVWFVVSFAVTWFARDLSVTFAGWPFGFWMGAQGALIVYCLIVWVYARRMDRADEAWRAGAEDGKRSG